MEASRVTVGDKTYDINILNGKRKTMLRRKAIIDYIQSKPAGAIISAKDFKQVTHFSTIPNAHAFVQRMIRDGIIARQEGDKPRTFSYVVIGAEPSIEPTIKKQSQPFKFEQTSEPKPVSLLKVFEALKATGLHFTITISSEEIKE